MSKSSLQRIYKSRRIRFKRIRRSKRIGRISQEEVDHMIVRIREQLAGERRSGSRVIFVDEAVFSSQTMQERAWSLPR
jgi:hypothetical protein